MSKSANLGFPRIGGDRELKRALEAFWAGKTRARDLEATGAVLRRAHWARQKNAGLDIIPCGDFSFYDQMLDMITTLGAVPARYRGEGLDAPFARYFAMARGTAGLPAMEMTKWFDTNYHYIVPELSPDLTFSFADSRIVDEFTEAKAQGFDARPVIIGPITFLRLAKVKAGDEGALDYLDRLLPVYAEILAALQAAGASWVQVDEPAFCLDLGDDWLAAATKAYGALAGAAPNIMLATYFGSVADKLPALLTLPVAGLHLDIVRAPNSSMARWTCGRGVKPCPLAWWMAAISGALTLAPRLSWPRKHAALWAASSLRSRPVVRSFTCRWT